MDTCFPIFHSNKTCIVHQEHASSYAKRICSLIPSFELFCICSLHVNLSHTTPRNVVCDTCSMFFPFKVMFSFGQCFLYANMIHLLFTLSDCFTVNHISSFSSSLVITRVVFTILLVE